MMAIPIIILGKVTGCIYTFWTLLMIGWWGFWKHVYCFLYPLVKGLILLFIFPIFLCFGGTLLGRRMDFWWLGRKQGDFLGGRKHQTITHCLQLMHIINIFTNQYFSWNKIFSGEHRQPHVVTYPCILSISPPSHA